MNKLIKVNVRVTDPIFNGYMFMIIRLIESACLVPRMHYEGYGMAQRPF